MVAAEAAYTHGEPWLEEQLAYLRGNHTHFAQAVNSATSKVRVLPADSLYARLWLDKGQKFGIEGHGYMRVNLGCPRSTVDEAIQRQLAARWCAVDVLAQAGTFLAGRFIGGSR